MEGATLNAPVVVCTKLDWESGKPVRADACGEEDEVVETSKV